MGGKRWPIAIAWGLVGVLALLYLTLPAFRSTVRRGFVLLASADVEQMRTYLLGYGAWAAIISAALMVLQALVLPLPSMALTMANGLVFGTLWGALLSWSSAMLAAVLCYYIARLMGRPLVTKLVGERPLGLADRVFDRYGRHAVLIARLIPVISFDVVSYAAGLSSIRLWGFVLATGIGQLPATILYSFLGENLPQAAALGLWIVFGVVTAVTVGLALRSRLEKDLVPPPAEESEE